MKGSIKRINNADTFLQPSLIIFAKGVNNSDHDCNYVCLFIWKSCFKKVIQINLNGSKIGFILNIQVYIKFMDICQLPKFLLLI